MKKLNGMILAAAMILSLAACAGGTNGNDTKESAYQLYQTSIQKMEQTTSLEAITNMTMSMSYGGETLEIGMEGYVKQIIHDETNIDMEMVMSTSSMGQEMDTTVYYTNGYYYMDLMGQKFKMSLPIEEIMAQANTEAFNFEESAVKNQSTTAKDGGSELSFTLNGEALSSQLGEQLGTLTESMGVEAGYSFGDITFLCVLDADGNLDTTELDMAFDITMQGETIPVTSKIYLEYVATENVTIDFPDDLDAYMEVDPAMLGM